MGKFEKDMVRFIHLHKQCDKARLIQNINTVMQEKGIKRRNKSRWVAEVTGTPIGSVNTWFTTAKCRDNNRIPPNAMCLLALALKVSVWRFLEGEEEKQKDGMVKPDRRSRAYSYIRRNQAEDAWNDRYAPQMGEWSKQGREVKQKFLDELYFQHLEENCKTGK
ncbi:MAG: hypothetical protein HFI74_13040 [Lachnospiraceae bacterium]|jgi:hypothetical protein|nr:hypothetical protein [Lachnospiraceae bacterium]